MIIQVQQLTKEYETYERGHTFKDTLISLFRRKVKVVSAVKGISFNVGKGEIVGFLGPNGAGKSTTLKILTGILFPTSGEVRVLGFVPWKQRKKYVARIGAVFGQKSQLMWDTPPLDAFHMNKAIYGIKEDKFQVTLDKLVDLLEVQDVIRKPTRQLSLGERMKCEFIMAMLHSPDIVFLDEPTIGLDVFAKEKIREFILEMNRQGVTFILTTHDLDDVERLAQRVIVINHGETVFDDSLGALRGLLGAKKSIRISTLEPLPEFSDSGILVKKRMSDYEAELEIDTSVISLNSFIQFCSETAVIADMEISNIPIEEMIKVLYVSQDIGISDSE
jgi:ABC-2 type transport system ATP-binding protein